MAMFFGAAQRSVRRPNYFVEKRMRNDGRLSVPVVAAVGAGWWRRGVLSESLGQKLKSPTVNERRRTAAIYEAGRRNARQRFKCSALCMAAIFVSGDFAMSEW